MGDLIRQFMKNRIQAILKDDYDLLEDFFDVIRRDAADYIIFISRRCFVLYQLIAFINKWKRDNVISDRGVWVYRKKLSQARRIILADDLLIWGSAMQTTYMLLKAVLDPNEEYDVKRVIYCKYVECNENDVAKVRAFSTRSMRECRLLTDRLVRSIMASGIPYTSFLYPFYGKIQGKEFPSHEKVVTFNRVEATKCKWESFYDFRMNQKLQTMLDYLCDGACIRYYYEQEKGFLCAIPFAFISDVKDQYLSTFYLNIATCCRESGWSIIATDIETASVDDSDGKWLYLAMLLSCVISRVMGVVEHIDKKFTEDYDREISSKSLEGVFPTHIFQCLEQLNEETCLCFVEKVLLKTDIWESCLIKLPKGEGNGDQDECLKEILSRFGDMRIKYERSHDFNDKKIDCKELYEIYTNRYSRNIIQAAQIECYDVGVATYGFRHEKEVGSVAQNGIGERGAVLFSLKYGKIIHQYFIANSEDEMQRGTLNDEQKRNNLIKVLQKEGVTKEEESVFWTSIRNDVNNIYDYYLNI